MKKFAAILLALVMVLTFVSVTACNPTAKTVTVTLYPTEDGTPMRRYHVVGTDDLTKYAGTNGDLVFDGWYYDKALTDKFVPEEDKTEEGTKLYGKWTSTSQGGDNNDNVTLEQLSTILSKYSNASSWSFADTVTVDYSGESYDDYYEYYGNVVLNRYEGTDGTMYTDYYDLSDDEVWYLYYDNGDGTYNKYADTTDEDTFYDSYGYTSIIDLSTIATYTYTASGNGFAAQNPSTAGNAVLGEYTDYSWTSLTVYVSNNNISKLVGVMNDGSVYTHVFSKHGTVRITLPDAEEGGAGDGDPLPTEPTGVMDNQVYNADTFDNSNLQDKLLKVDEAIGLPSTGEYNVLVIPVQFKNDNISDAQIAKLDKAFNGDSTSTGWESVKSYYEKSSYGQLKLSFDITDVFQASKTAAKYSSYKETIDYSEGEGSWDKDGSALILEEALSWCVSQNIDLSQYDTNGDGCIDAVYLIYSEEVDYDDADFFWAYVTWYGGETTFDNLDAYYYLFAGFDFMDENLDKMNGVTVNAETYIHETGHLLGLDDYYDYSENRGGDLGLGGADMMDYNIGDHGVYTKIMLGWLTPEIVTSTQTITINSLQGEGATAILVPLNWDNTYFCEYLLIDLYSAQGLNAMNAAREDTILYGGAEYGVRIYHVTSWANDPYNNSYGSFTDYNNSNSNIPLIKLIEADGETSKSTQGSWASESDLWQEGDSFNAAYPQYMRNDGKTLNFNITIESVSATEATVRITFNS